MKKILILALSLCYAGELEVDGDLTVVGQIQSPTIDALGGMKPERIYMHHQAHDDPSFSFTVPENKLWIVYCSASSSTLMVNNKEVPMGWGGVIMLLPNSIMASYVNANASKGYYTIYEYPFNSSGTDQGLDYIEP